MPGRHSVGRRRRRRWPRRLAVTLVVLAMLGTGGYFARDYFIDDAQASCDGSLPGSVDGMVTCMTMIAPGTVYRSIRLLTVAPSAAW